MTVQPHAPGPTQLLEHSPTDATQGETLWSGSVLGLSVSLTQLILLLC